MCLSGRLHPAAVVVIAPRPARPRAVQQSTRVFSCSPLVFWLVHHRPAMRAAAIAAERVHRRPRPRVLDRRGLVGAGAYPGHQYKSSPRIDSSACRPLKRIHGHGVPRCRSPTVACALVERAIDGHYPLSYRAQPAAFPSDAPRSPQRLFHPNEPVPFSPRHARAIVRLSSHEWLGYPGAPSAL
jgi:hypothetical protein